MIPVYPGNVQQIYASLGAFAAIRADGAVATWGHPAYGGDSSIAPLTKCWVCAGVGPWSAEKVSSRLIYMYNYIYMYNI